MSSVEIKDFANNSALKNINEMHTPSFSTIHDDFTAALFFFVKFFSPNNVKTIDILKGGK